MTHPLRLQQLVKLVDLTRLNESDRPEDVQQWLEQQLPTAGQLWPAAVCIYPEFIPLVRHILSERAVLCAVATVVNFPGGEQSVEQVLAEINAAIAAGADEIDCVLPYRSFLQGKVDEVRGFLQRVRLACGDKSLKVIIESGELATPQQIGKATELVIECGADFVKSSTGKVAIGITEEAARVMLTTIAAATRRVGFKASGGVKSIAYAEQLLDMYEQITGHTATAEWMRIGASGLMQDLTGQLAY